VLDKLAMLRAALYERRKIQYDIFRDIQKDSIWCQNQLFAIEKAYDPALDRPWKLRKLDLGHEYRQERAAYFRDLTMLQKEIRDTMLDYIKENQMEALWR
jgi:hypothetical protein